MIRVNKRNLGYKIGTDAKIMLQIQNVYSQVEVKKLPSEYDIVQYDHCRKFKSSKIVKNP